MGGDGVLSVGGDVVVASGGSGAATFGDGVSVSGGSVRVESVDALVGVGRTVEVSGSEGVRVASEGAAVEEEPDPEQLRLAEEFAEEQRTRGPEGLQNGIHGQDGKQTDVGTPFLRALGTPRTTVRVSVSGRYACSGQAR